MPLLSNLSQIIRLSRLFDAAFPIVSLLLGAAITTQLHNNDIFLLTAVVVILNSVAMIWNDIEDKEIDADNGRPELAKSSVGALRHLKTRVIVLIVVSLLLAGLVNIVALLLAITTVGVIWIYNSKPVQASRRPILSIVVLSGAGAFIPYLFGLSLGGIEAHTFVAGICWWLGRISLSVLKDYKDARGDARHHKKTFLLRYGAHKVALISTLSLCIGYAAFLYMVYPMGSSAWGLLLLIIAIGIFCYMRRPLFAQNASYFQLDGTFRTIAQSQLLLDVGVVLWLI